MFAEILARSKAAVLVVLLAGALVGTGCDSVETEPPENISFNAVVQLFIIGDGPNTYALSRHDSNVTYYPLNLPKEFQQEGLNVHVEGLLIKHYQVLLLPPVEIVSITPLPPQ